MGPTPEPRARRRLAALRREWADYRMTLQLDQSLVLYLEDQVRWMMSQGPAGKQAPNVLDALYPKALQDVQPDAVRLVEWQE